MRLLYIIIILVIFEQHAIAQMDCLVLSSTASSSCSSCSDFNSYSNFLYKPEHTPVKNVRIVIHVFNKNDGTGNLPNTTTSRNWINLVVAQMNAIWSDLQPMNLPGPNPSNYHKDSRIRLSLQDQDIYFWNDDGAFGAAHDGYDPIGTHINTIYYNYVTNQPLVLHKETAIHLFLSGYEVPNRGYARAIGSNALVASGLPQNYATLNHSQMANIINHELGHCLGLNHTWNEGDGCDDTPPNANCWNGPTCSTNMMDYNAQQWSLTQCQLNKIHYNLMTNNAISNTLISSMSTDNSIITGNDVICTTAKEFTIPNLQFGVTVSWSASPSTNVVMPNPCGAPILISTNTSAISSTTLSATLCYGKYGSLSTPTKLLAINTLTGANTLICGNGTGVITGGNIQSSPYPPCTTPFYTTNGQKTKLVANSFIELNQFEFGQGSDVELVISSCP